MQKLTHLGSTILKSQNCKFNYKKNHVKKITLETGTYNPFGAIVGKFKKGEI